MRVYVLYLVVAFLALYAYRDWFLSTCGLIVMLAFVEHPDFPKTIGDVQGLNPWNIVLANVLLAWFFWRQRCGLSWDMPGVFRLLLLTYLAVILVGFIRMMGDRRGLEEFTTAFLLSEHVVNTVKWTLPGLLLFDGCRSRRQLLVALICILCFYAALAAQVIRWMPPGSVMAGSELAYRARKVIPKEVGYHPINVSMMLAGASWAMLATLPLAPTRTRRLLIVALFVAVSYAQALTGGRMGYVTWGVVGLILSLLRWRKYLLLAPLVVIGVGFAVPGAVERMLAGFGVVTATGERAVDDYEVTSGRTLIWPHVVEKIGRSPVIGHGRLAMYRTGLRDRLLREFNESFPHPHNAYLECLLDNGAIGFVLIGAFYTAVLICAGRLFFDNTSPVYVVVGGVTLALVLALLIAAMGSQTFYPREGAVGMWAAIGLMIRVWVVRKRAAAALAAAEIAVMARVFPR